MFFLRIFLFLCLFRFDCPDAVPSTSFLPMEMTRMNRAPDLAGRGMPPEGDGDSPADAPGALLHPSLAAFPVGILVADAALSDVRSNAAAAAILEVPPAVNLLERNVSPAPTVFRENEPVPPGLGPLARALRGEEVRGEEHDLVFASGSWTPILVTALPMREGGRTVAAVCAIEDISRLKEAERRLEVRRREAIEASIDRNGRLSVAFHDIRSTLNASNLLAELLAHLSAGAPGEEEILKLIGDLKGSHSTVIQEIEAAIRLAKTPGPEEAPESEFAAGPFLFEEGKHHFAEARSRGIRLEIRPPPALVRLRTDRPRLAHAVGSVLGAAIRSTRSGWVRLSGTAMPDGVPAFLVEDTGGGIAVDGGIPSDPSWTSPADAGGEPENGEFRLWRKILEPIGGTISVERTPGSGSLHSIRLPPSTFVRPPVSAAPAAGAARAAGSPANEPRNWWL
jgi:signal transduction histidine kinase